MLFDAERRGQATGSNANGSCCGRGVTFSLFIVFPQPLRTRRESDYYPIGVQHKAFGKNDVYLAISTAPGLLVTLRQIKHSFSRSIFDTGKEPPARAA